MILVKVAGAVRFQSSFIRKHDEQPVARGSPHAIMKTGRSEGVNALSLRPVNLGGL
jgi:hypothetical protein